MITRDMIGPIIARAYEILDLSPELRTKVRLVVQRSYLADELNLLDAELGPRDGPGLIAPLLPPDALIEYVASHKDEIRQKLILAYAPSQ